MFANLPRAACTVQDGVIFKHSDHFWATGFWSICNRSGEAQTEAKVSSVTSYCPTSVISSTSQTCPCQLPRLRQVPHRFWRLPQRFRCRAIARPDEERCKAQLRPNAMQASRTVSGPSTTRPFPCLPCIIIKGDSPTEKVSGLTTWNACHVTNFT